MADESVELVGALRLPLGGDQWLRQRRAWQTRGGWPARDRKVWIRMVRYLVILDVFPHYRILPDSVSRLSDLYLPGTKFLMMASGYLVHR